MATQDHTSFHGGSNAANRFTPEQKLIRVGRAFKVYKACTRRVLLNRDGIHWFAFDSPEHKTRAASVKQWSRYAQIISDYIGRLTAPADDDANVPVSFVGGAE